MIWLVMVATTTTIALGQHGHGRGQDRDRDHREHRGDREERMVRTLDLTDEQQEAIEDLRVAHAKAVKADQDALRLKMVQLRSETTEESPNKSDIDQLTDEIGALQTNLLKARVSHKMEVRAILDDEQKIKFDQMHRKRLHRGGRDW